MLKIDKTGVKATLTTFLEGSTKEQTSIELATLISEVCNVDLTVWHIKSHRITGNIWTVNGNVACLD